VPHPPDAFFDDQKVAERLKLDFCESAIAFCGYDARRAFLIRDNDFAFLILHQYQGQAHT
jgi:hypothetical protein